jgi:MFS family permease
MVLAATGFGLGILCTALAPWLWLSYVALLFVGWASVSFISIGNSTIQLASAPNMRGRVLSLWQLAFQGTTPVGGPLIGWVIEESDARTGMLVGAVSCLVASAGGAVLSRHRRRSALDVPGSPNGEANHPPVPRALNPQARLATPAGPELGQDPPLRGAPVQ